MIPSSVRTTFLLVVTLLLSPALTGCLVAGYSSGGGWFVWSGSIVITLLLVLFFFLQRGR
jgi:hypothetical protein